MPEKPGLTSSELGVLWLTYQHKTMILRILEYFIEKADDEKAKNIMVDLYDEIEPYVKKITVIFQNEEAAIPVGFTSEDVNKGVPKLYDNGFDIMFVRLLKAISMALHTLSITMASREDIIMVFKDFTAITQKYYNAFTDTSYLRGGLNPLSRKRTMNTVEVANMFHALDANITGFQMITGFAQCANSAEVKKYFTKGGEISKSIIKEISEVFLEDGIQTPAVSGGNPTRSTVAPFSDKLMMYCTSLFCSFTMGGNSLGTAFSLRNDLSAKAGVFMTDIFEYAHEGAKIMIRNGWAEKQPPMEEREKLI